MALPISPITPSVYFTSTYLLTNRLPTHWHSLLRRSRLGLAQATGCATAVSFSPARNAICRVMLCQVIGMMIHEVRYSKAASVYTCE